MGWFSSMFSGRKQRLAMMTQAQQYQEQLHAQEEATNRQIAAQREMATQVSQAIRATNAQSVQEAAATTVENPDSMTSGNTATNAKRRGRSALRIDRTVGAAGGGSGLNIAN